MTHADTLVLNKSLLHARMIPRLLADAVRGAVSAWAMISRFNPDAVYVNTVTLPLWPTIARLRGVPVLTHVHEAELSVPRVVRWGLYAPFAPSNRIVVNSDFTRTAIGSVAPGMGRRAQVVYNGVPGPSVVSSPRRRLDGPARVLYIGRLSPRKGPDLLVEAAALLRDRGIDIAVDLLGSAYSGYEWYEQKLRTRISELGLDGAVRVLGFQSDVWPHLAASDMLVVPSRADESFGNTAVEGLLAARPVIVSDVGGLPEAIASSAGAQKVTPDDPAAIADAIGNVITAWPMYVDHALSDAVYAADRFDPARYRADVASIMGELSGHRPHRVATTRSAPALALKGAE